MDLARILGGIASDHNILNGDENLHPDWILIFNQHRERLERFMDPRSFEELRQASDAQEPIDSLLRTINPEEEQIVFLLGAGASKPSPSDIPTVTELLPELLRRARRLDQDQVTALTDFCDRQGIDNIEDLLTAVQISAFCNRNPRILRLVEFQLFSDADPERARRRAALGPARTDVSSVAYLQDTLQVLFALLSNLMLPANPNGAHQAIVDYLRNKPSTPIVTTNYDCCIDQALTNNKIPFTYSTEFVNTDVSPNPPSEAASLIKLHGSLNWFYCERCQKVRLIDIGETFKDYKNQRSEYPIISVCYECGGQKRALLVPPQAMKFDVVPPLQTLIAKATSCFEDKTLIVVVGFSFADADSYISRMLIKAMQESSNTKMVIVDPNRDVIDKVRRKFDVLQIPNFDLGARILKLQGDCAEMLPQFLRGELLQTSEDNSGEHNTNGKLGLPNEATIANPTSI